MTLPKPPICIYLGILAFAVFLTAVVIIDLVDTGTLFPSYHCSHCKVGQYGKPNIYGMCDKCSGDFIWQAREELGGEYLLGRTDEVLMGKVREYLQ